MVIREEIKNLPENPGVYIMKDKEEKILYIGKAISLKKRVRSYFNKISSIIVKNKAPYFIGSRMGRPEKAKIRKLTGSPNILFPVGREGGRFRSIQVACEAGKIRSAFPIYYCEQCKKETIYPTCENCGKECKKVYRCFECDKNYFGKCEEHNLGATFYTRDIDMKYYYDKAAEN